VNEGQHHKEAAQPGMMSGCTRSVWSSESDIHPTSSAPHASPLDHDPRGIVVIIVTPANSPTVLAA
jgi:hypothetical protein